MTKEATTTTTVKEFTLIQAISNCPNVLSIKSIAVITMDNTGEVALYAVGHNLLLDKRFKTVTDATAELDRLIVLKFIDSIWVCPTNGAYVCVETRRVLNLITKWGKQ
ncbi:MAG: hypothetical protein GY799_02040 [Desulfobulbaceae bacterium]|nr:hypothetical protein [Desulfobulbaceae bacterium]